MNEILTKADFYFGPRYRKSPFFEATRRAGCKAWGIYNHMYIPNYYDDPIEEYRSLTEDVTLWDVSVERIVEITGPDASEFTNRLTPRDLTKCAVGQGKYVLITAEDGGIVNEPVLLRLGENQWWLALSDYDAGLWARGYSVGCGLDVKVREPEIYPVQVQGPKSRDVMIELFGDAVAQIRYYWTMGDRSRRHSGGHQPDRMERRDRVRNLSPRPEPRRRVVGPDHGSGKAAPHPADRALADSSHRGPGYFVTAPT